MYRAIVAILVTAIHGFAQNTIHIPADQPTIQAGINAASSGDTVLVAPGTYKESINFSRKAITVTSSGGPSVTIIDGNNSGTPVTYNQGETTTSGKSTGQLVVGAPGFTETAVKLPLTQYALGIYTVGSNNQAAVVVGAAAGPALATTTVNPTVMLGSESLNVSFSGLTPGLMGLYQVNATIPTDAATGPAVSLTVLIGGSTSNAATIAVQ